ncbi:MAG: FAD binding domain-containing protein, partial [Chloroflexota bacterium]|nr:FAD binding domain-containing protein [Chloroflexota bacterium]
TLRGPVAAGRTRLMLRLPHFRYLAPRDLDEAAALLAEHAPRAAVVAGGTDLYPNMKRRQQEPAILIGLRGISCLRRIEPVDDSLRIGATASLHEVATHPVVQQRYPALSLAAGLVSTPHLRRMGTLGGNLCLDTRCTYYDQTYHWRKSIDFCLKKDGQICWVAPGSKRCWAVSSSDTAPVAVALRARLSLASATGKRNVDAGEFFRDDGILYLTRRPDEILSSIEFPGLDGWHMTYQKLRRRGSFDFPILGVAAAVKIADGVVEDARLVLGAVGSSPVDQSNLAQPLVGTRPTREAIQAVAAEAYKGARPLDNTDLNYAWRKKMARVYVERALARVCGVQLPALNAEQ